MKTACTTSLKYSIDLVDFFSNSRREMKSGTISTSSKFKTQGKVYIFLFMRKRGVLLQRRNLWNLKS